MCKPVEIAPGEDDFSTLGPGASSSLEPDSCTTADHDDGLSGQFRFTLGGGGHDSSDRLCGDATRPPDSGRTSRTRRT